MDLTTTQKEILLTSVIFFEESVLASKLSFEYMLDRAKEDETFHLATQNSHIQMEIEAAKDILEDIEEIKKQLTNSIDSEEDKIV